MSPVRVADERTRIFNLTISFRGRLPDLNCNRHDAWAGLLQRLYPIAEQLSAAFPTDGWRERQTGGRGGGDGLRVWREGGLFRVVAVI